MSPCTPIRMAAGELHREIAAEREPNEDDRTGLARERRDVAHGGIDRLERAVGGEPLTGSACRGPGEVGHCNGEARLAERGVLRAPHRARGVEAVHEHESRGASGHRTKATSAAGGRRPR